jgi:acylphosphatase
MIVRRMVVHGRVQGVFYRGWTVGTARTLGLGGWVRNRRDGTVEILVGGEEGAVHRMIELCRRGPSAARVERVDVAESGEEAPASFEQRPSA